MEMRVKIATCCTAEINLFLFLFNSNIQPMILLCIPGTDTGLTQGGLKVLAHFTDDRRQISAATF